MGDEMDASVHLITHCFWSFKEDMGILALSIALAVI